MKLLNYLIYQLRRTGEPLALNGWGVPSGNHAAVDLVGRISGGHVDHAYPFTGPSGQIPERFDLSMRGVVDPHLQRPCIDDKKMKVDEIKNIFQDLAKAREKRVEPTSDAILEAMRDTIAKREARRLKPE